MDSVHDTLFTWESDEVHMSKQIDMSRQYLPTPEAARRAGLTRIYLAQLLRQGRLDGFQLGREWFVYTDSLETFLATPRKPGPQGPRKKAESVQSDGEADER